MNCEKFWFCAKVRDSTKFYGAGAIDTAEIEKEFMNTISKLKGEKFMDNTIQRDKDGRIISFDVPAQVKWYDYDYDDGRDYNEPEDYENAGGWAYGIAYGSSIICACCGGIIPIEDIYEFAPSELSDPIRPLGFWENFSDAISD